MRGKKPTKHSGLFLESFLVLGLQRKSSYVRLIFHSSPSLSDKNLILIILIITILSSLFCHHYLVIILGITQECKLNFNPLHGAVSTFKGWRPPWSTLLSVHHRWECIAPALFWRTARIIILGLKCARRITQSAWSSPQLRPPHPHSKCSWWWDLESNPGWSLSGLDPLDWVEFLQSDLRGRITASGKI